MPMKKILFILSGNLSTTPRALKAALLTQTGYEVHLLGVNRGSNWELLDDELVRRYNLSYQVISLARKPFLKWFILGMTQAVSRKLSPWSRGSLRIAAYTSNKASIALSLHLRKITDRYDLVIGHGSGALYPVYDFSTQRGIPFAFDVEDYHPEERIEHDTVNEKARREFLLKEILPNAAFFTYASPLIGKAVLDLLGELSLPGHDLINNCFSSRDFIAPDPCPDNEERISFVWFSQWISYDRGLELFVPALQTLSDKIHLTLIGNLDQKFFDQHLKGCTNSLTIIPPLPQSELHRELSHHSVGLAIEMSSTELNKQFALSNKIFAYAQAGLYILATDTPAQISFMKEHPWSGILAGQNAPDLIQATAAIIADKEKMQCSRNARYEEARSLSWENESGKLYRLIFHAVGQGDPLQFEALTQPSNPHLVQTA